MELKSGVWFCVFLKCGLMARCHKYGGGICEKAIAVLSGRSRWVSHSGIGGSGTGGRGKNTIGLVYKPGQW